MTDPIGTAQERELIERLKSRTYAGTRPSHRGDRSVWTLNNPDGAEAADALRQLGGDWFDKAIRDHCDEHGPSGEAWNISMILERLHRARAALSLQRRV